MGRCKFYQNDDIYPYPPGSKILYWGNSHLREMIQAINCQSGTTNTSQLFLCFGVFHACWKKHFYFTDVHVNYVSSSGQYSNSKKTKMGTEQKSQCSLKDYDMISNFVARVCYVWMWIGA